MSPNIHLLKPNPQCDDVRRWGFGKLLGHEGGASMTGMSALIKGTSESFLVRTQGEDAVREPGAGPHQTPNLLKP